MAQVRAVRVLRFIMTTHAGEDGLLGTEEKDIIVPAISEARSRRILAFGPYAADGFFGSGNYTVFDGVLAMYHDQGLAPFKTLAMDAGVNFTAGLPYVRTSPDHGTGYDITGKNLANPESLRCAVYAAIDIFNNREAYDAAFSRPLRHQHLDKERPEGKERPEKSPRSDRNSKEESKAQEADDNNE